MRLEQRRRAVINPEDAMLESVDDGRFIHVQRRLLDQGCGENFWRDRAAFKRVKFRQPPPMAATKIEIQSGEGSNAVAAPEIDDDAAKVEQQNWRRHAFFEAIHSSMRRSRMPIGKAPPPSTASWNPRMSNLSPSSVSALARNSWIFRMPTLYAVA